MTTFLTWMAVGFVGGALSVCALAAAIYLGKEYRR